MKNTLRKLSITTLLIAMIFSFSACGKNSQQSDEQSKGSSSSAINQNSQSQNELGDFKAQNLEGKEFTNEIFTDNDLTMVNIWATTCGYCIDEMPYLNEIRTEMKNNNIKFNIVGICLDAGEVGNIDEKKLVKIKEIIEKTGVEYETLIPDDILINGRLKSVTGVPETLFIDKEGKLVGESILGAHEKNEWINIINKKFDSIKK